MFFYHWPAQGFHTQATSQTGSIRHEHHIIFSVALSAESAGIGLTNLHHLLTPANTAYFERSELSGKRDHYPWTDWYSRL